MSTIPTPVIREAVIVGAYYDSMKKAIVLSSQIEGIETVFQTPMPESSWTFPKGCLNTEFEKHKTAKLFNSSKGRKISLQFDGGDDRWK